MRTAVELGQLRVRVAQRATVHARLLRRVVSVHQRHHRCVARPCDRLACRHLQSPLRHAPLHANAHAHARIGRCHRARGLGLFVLIETELRKLSSLARATRDGTRSLQQRAHGGSGKSPSGLVQRSSSPLSIFLSFLGELCLGSLCHLRCSLLCFNCTPLLLTSTHQHALQSLCRQTHVDIEWTCNALLLLTTSCDADACD